MPMGETALAASAVSSADTINTIVLPSPREVDARDRPAHDGELAASVMAGLVPATHVLLASHRRGCAGQARA